MTISALDDALTELVGCANEIPSKSQTSILQCIDAIKEGRASRRENVDSILDNCFEELFEAVEKYIGQLEQAMNSVYSDQPELGSTVQTMRQRLDIKSRWLQTLTNTLSREHYSAPNVKAVLNYARDLVKESPRMLVNS